MNDKNSLHFDFLLEEERFSPSQLRLRFMAPVMGVLCLLATIVVWVQESSQVSGVISKKQIVEAEIASLKIKHENVLKESAELKELAAQLQQLGFYQKSKNAVGTTLANLTNCVSSRIQLTELRLLTQTAAPFNAPQVRPKNAGEIAKLCPTNQVEGMSLRLVGRSIQSGGNPVEVNRFLQALQDPVFKVLCNPESRPKVSFREEASSFSARVGDGNQQEIVSFEIVYECLPRRFQ